jgi:PAS domain S-box-containing protein
VRPSPTPNPTPIPSGETVAARERELFQAALDHVYRHRDKVFVVLMGAQWALCVALALILSPQAWTGKIHTAHVHVFYGVFLGGALTLPMALLACVRPGWVGTRHVAAVSQMLFSALLIHLSGGRIETHFHVFGSLAFLAFYRDWRVLLTATLVVAFDHLVRGYFWAESVYGITNPEWWRFLEHAFWVVFEDVVLLMGILHNLREMRLLAARQAELEALNTTIEHRVADRTRELETSREQYRSLVEKTQSVPWQWDVAGKRFSYVGPQGGSLLGCSTGEWLRPEFLRERVHPADLAAVLLRYEGGSTNGEGGEIEYRLRRNDGSWVWIRSLSSPGSRQRIVNGLLLDVTERRQMEFDLQQAQKLESVGRLASGVAHEINTPIQFVSDSLHFLRSANADLAPVMSQYRQLLASARQGPIAEEALVALESAEGQADLPFLVEQIPTAIARSLDGLQRVATIVRALKEFAHPEQNERKAADLNHALTTTLTMASNEYRYVADVETDFAELPRVMCHVGELNQVFLNLIVNAAHAIEECVPASGDRGLIRIATRLEGAHAVISISDTGCGVPESIRGKIFDPFFTTKEVGKGTGQGLAIARSVVVDKHGGTLSFDSEPGHGTTFVIRLPVGSGAGAGPASVGPSQSRFDPPGATACGADPAPGE